MATCLVKGYGISNYTNEDHLLQIDIKEVVVDIFRMKPEEILTGVDGCSVPVYAMPLYNMALG